MSTVKRNGDKIILNNNAVSCNCCCSIDSCDNIVIPTYSELFEEYRRGGGGGSYNPETGAPYGDDALNSPTAGRFNRRPACLRFYYRVVNENLGEDGEVLCSGQIGSSGVRNGLSAAETVFGYREDKTNLLNGESCGMYIYAISFYFWHSSCTRNEFWSGSGAQPNPLWPTSGTLCNTIKVYNVDMFTVGQNQIPIVFNET
jgi:hypothetical protein